MIKIDDLTGIPENKRKRVIECLDDLITFNDDEGRPAPIITGYNWYARLSEFDHIITFSNIYGTKNYQQDMIRDLAKLGYESEFILKNIREKAAAYLHKMKFILLPGIRIKDIRIGEYLDLKKFLKPLINYPQFRDAEGYLIAEDQGWELDLPFNNKIELLNLIDLFLRKSGEEIFDEKGNIIEETQQERKLRSPWSNAYEVPVLLLGESALEYSNELPHFAPANKISLIENSNEISFIIHKNLDYLKKLSHYEELLKLGFHEEICLANKPFLTYVDEFR